MRLPEELRQAIDEQAARVDASALARAARELSARYRAGEFRLVLNSEASRAAYLVTRMPATLVAIQRVLGEIAGRTAGPIRSVLDLGSGPGTAGWAATEALPGVEQITLVERDAAVIETGRRMAEHARHPALRAATWICGDLRGALAVQPHDLVVSAYAAGETGGEAAVAELARSMWKLAREAVVFIEPGTPRGFGHVLAARAALLEAGGALLAPCPHEKDCPMAAAGDWCHFAQRLERSAEHRRIKGGELGYEDEKFSYVAASKVPATRAGARIVRHPMKHGGHVQITLCAPEGLVRRTVTKSQKENYRRARKAEWGDAWDG
jgi:ribosomal protein RSM22 (predicted rRNA methylase)